MRGGIICVRCLQVRKCARVTMLLATLQRMTGLVLALQAHEQCEPRGCLHAGEIPKPVL